jgi:hypothetical protein
MWYLLWTAARDSNVAISCLSHFKSCTSHSDSRYGYDRDRTIATCQVTPTAYKLLDLAKCGSPNKASGKKQRINTETQSTKIFMAGQFLVLYFYIRNLVCCAWEPNNNNNKAIRQYTYV